MQKKGKELSQWRKLRLKELWWMSLRNRQRWRKSLGNKSRALWLKQGDKNTRFFHKMANACRRRNFMAKLRVDGVMLDGEDSIKEAITNAFQRIMAETGEWRPSIYGLVFDSLQLVDLKLWRPLSLKRRSL